MLTNWNLKICIIVIHVTGPKSRTATAVSTARRGTVAVIGAMTGNTIADAIFGRRPTKAGQNPSDTSAPFADRQSQQTQRRQISTNKSAPSPPTTASPLLLTQTRHQGRKPMRQIAAEIADKIKTLETNHLEFEVLLTKIQTYREEELNASARRDIVQKNKKIMEKYRVDLRSEITHEKVRSDDIQAGYQNLHNKTPAVIMTSSAKIRYIIYVRLSNL